MATAVITWNTWNVEYYETMAATERARQRVTQAQHMGMPMGVRVFVEAILWYPFRRVTRDTEQLVSLLEKLESYPFSEVLKEDADKMPESLRELFRKMCDVLQKTEELGLSDGRLLCAYFNRMGELSQKINDFAERYEDANKKLKIRVSPEETSHYRESYEAYWSADLKSDQATDDDEAVKKPSSASVRRPVRESFGRLGFSIEKSGCRFVCALSCFSWRQEPLAACLDESIVAGCR